MLGAASPLTLQPSSWGKNLVGNCSATRCSVAAPRPGARQGFGGPMHPRHPLRWQGERCDRGLLGGCSCDTPATHSEQRNEPRQGCSYAVERDRGGGVASAPLRVRSKENPPKKQIRQFGGHIFVHIFALYVGVGVAKQIPQKQGNPRRQGSEGQGCTILVRERSRFEGLGVVILLRLE